MKLDRTSGATTVADKIIGHLHKWLIKSKHRPLAELLSGLEKECLEFLAEYPVMGNIYGLINAVGLGVDHAAKRGIQTSDLFDEIASRIGPWWKNEFKALHTIPKLAVRAIGSRKTILTLSSSELVKQTFLAFKKKKVKAIVLESRPLREGERMAYGLAQAGIPTTLIIDLAFPSLEREVDAVLVGADRISNTLVNKVGTKALLEWAHLTKKPVFVVCQSSKFVPASWCVRPLPHAPFAEVSKLRHPKLAVRNFYFEECPIGLTGSITTEAGVLDRHTIRKKMAAIETSEWLRRLLKIAAGLKRSF